MGGGEDGRRRGQLEAMSGGARTADGHAREILERVFRRERSQILAVLIRLTGDFSLAEDALQDAFTAALARWPDEGVPPRPGAWITTTARRRAIDVVRRAAEAARCFRRGIEQCRNPAERAHLRRRLAEVEGGADHLYP